MTAMRPLAALVLLALAASLSACDTFSDTDDELAQRAEVAVGATYSGTSLALRDAETGDLVYDYLANGATIAVEFTSANRFEASLFVPYAALEASGQTEDADGEDVRQEITGTYAQADGTLTFTFDTWVDSFFSDRGWRIAPDGASIAYESAEDGVVLDVVLARG